jgi:hypothetical protein
MTEEQKKYKIPETKEVVANRVTRMEEDDILPAVQSPSEQAASAILRGASLEHLAALEKAWEFDIRVKEQQAKEAYHEAMSKFAANLPEIEKDRKVGYDHKDGHGSTSYAYAGLGNVAQKIQTALSEHQLHAAWDPEQSESGIKVTCTITHALGHSESTSLIAPPDNTGKKNPIQAIASTISYLERYTILALTGLATHDMDDDGADSEPDEAISDDQFADINALIEEVGADEAKFCKWLKVESIDKLPIKKYDHAIKALERKRK